MYYQNMNEQVELAIQVYTLLNDEVKIGNKNSWYMVIILLEVAKAKSLYISRAVGYF